MMGRTTHCPHSGTQAKIGSVIFSRSPSEVTLPINIPGSKREKGRLGQLNPLLKDFSPKMVPSSSAPIPVMGSSHMTIPNCKVSWEMYSLSD